MIQQENKERDPFIIQEGRFGKLDDFSYRLEWTEDSFILGEHGTETVGRTFDFAKLGFISAVLFFFLALILLRAGWLQILKRDYYYGLAEGNRIRIESIVAKRGVVYDQKMRPLVRNAANFLLYFVPADLPSDQTQKNQMMQEIADIVGTADMAPVQDYLNKLQPRSLNAYRPLFVKDNIPYDKALALSMESDNWPGVFLSNSTRRNYNFASSSLSHLLGYTGKINDNEMKKYGAAYSPIDYLGKTGLEYFWETDLRGNNGRKEVEVDALGKEKDIINYTTPSDGHNLVLSLDVDVQKKLEETMSAMLVKSKLARAVGIVSNPNNGEIIAMVSMPFYDNNDFAGGISSAEYKQLISDPNRPLFNRAISGEYPSGSTIKPVMAIGALEDGIINENTSFLSNGGIRVNQWFFPDWKGQGHGITNVRKGIAESVNTFFYIIGGGYKDFKGLGVDRIVYYDNLFGLSRQTGIDLPGEADGFLPTQAWKEKVKGESWYVGDTYHISIGQGDLTVTPLQVNNYTNYFANGGKFYRPHLVKEILDSSDNLLMAIDDSPIKSNLASQKNINIVREGMRLTITGGSARSLQEVPVPVAGKTGTAQWNTKKKPHSWFTGFAPYNNPEIVITVLVEEGNESTDTAVPIAREFLKWYFGASRASSTAGVVK